MRFLFSLTIASTLFLRGNGQQPTSPEDGTPFKCNEKNRYDGSDKSSNETRTFLRLNGKPFNCEEDISAFYEITGCGEIDHFKVKKGNCYWKNEPRGTTCAQLDILDNNGESILSNENVAMTFAYVPKQFNPSCPSQLLTSVWDDIKSTNEYNIYSVQNASDSLNLNLIGKKRDNDNTFRQPLKKCPGKSAYAFFNFYVDGTTCYFYSYDPSHPHEGVTYDYVTNSYKEGFHYRTLDNCKNVADICTSDPGQTMNCSPIANGISHTDLVIRVGNGNIEDVTSCPKILILQKQEKGQEKYLTGYVGMENPEDEINTEQDSGNSINFMRDDLGNLQQVTIKYKSTTEQADINAGKMAFLKEILNTIVEPNSNSTEYQCNTPKSQEIMTGPFLRLKGVPFNCEVSQYQDYPLELCNSYEEIYLAPNYCGSYTTGESCSYEMCKHAKGQFDCLPISEKMEKWRMMLLKWTGENDSNCPKVLGMFEDRTRLTDYWNTFSSMHCGEAYSGVGLISNSSYLEKELEECGGAESYVGYVVGHRGDKCEFGTKFLGEYEDLLTEEINCADIQICQNPTDCKPLIEEENDFGIFVAVRKFPKKSCPNVIMQVSGREPGRRQKIDGKWYFSYPNSKITNFVHDWSFLQPKIHMPENPDFVEMNIKFNSAARSDADLAKLAFLEDILKIVVE